MARWYLGFTCVGRSETVVQEIGAAIRNRGLWKTVPSSRRERRSRGEFCIFLAVDHDPEGAIPLPLQELISQHRQLKRRIPGTFSLDQIRTMVSGDIDFDGYAPRLPSYHPAPRPYQDPFAPASRMARLSVPPQRTTLFDLLMQWLSATDAGSWATFQHACDTLGLLQGHDSAARILRRLRLLGHIECSRDGQRWSVAPSVLTRVDSSQLMPENPSATYILCGARHARLRAWLEGNSALTMTPQADGDGPSVWTVATSDPEGLANRLRQSDLPMVPRLVTQSGLALARALPSLDDWANTLPTVTGIEPALLDVKIYNGEEFVPTVFEAHTGLYELWPAGPRSHALERPRYTLFYNSTAQCWRRGDWYGLRYLSRTMTEDYCPIQYDQHSGNLAVANDWRFPDIYERSLVLSSGRLPGSHPTGAWLVYRHIPAPLVDTLTAKLHLLPQKDMNHA